jgi:hypothetical protein
VTRAEAIDAVVAALAAGGCGCTVQAGDALASLLLRVEAEAQADALKRAARVRVPAERCTFNRASWREGVAETRKAIRACAAKARKAEEADGAAR